MQIYACLEHAQRHASSASCLSTLLHLRGASHSSCSGWNGAFFFSPRWFYHPFNVDSEFESRRETKKLIRKLAVSGWRESFPAERMTSFCPAVSRHSPISDKSFVKLAFLCWQELQYQRLGSRGDSPTTPLTLSEGIDKSAAFVNKSLCARCKARWEMPLR